METFGVITIKARLEALLETVIDKSNFNKAFLPVIKNLAKGFLKNTSEEDIRKGLIELREKYIPWILGEMPDENPHRE